MKEEPSKGSTSEQQLILASDLNHRRRKNLSKHTDQSIDFSMKDFENMALLQQNHGNNDFRKLQDNMTYFPRIKNSINNVSMSLPLKIREINESTSSPQQEIEESSIRVKILDMSHRASIDSFDYEFGTIPILQRQAISVTRKSFNRK